MKETLDVLGWAQTVGFALIALATTAAWLRRPSRDGGFLALAVGLLGLVSVVGRVEQVTNDYPAVVARLTIPAFLVSGFALALYRHSVMPTRRWVLGVLVALLAGVTAASFLISLPTGLDPTLSGVQWALVWAMVGLWGICVVEPAVRFWLVSSGLPSVQRARLRALSAGYGGIVVLLVLALFVAVVVGPHVYTNAAYQLVVAIAGTITVPLLYLGFAPPRVVRQFWTAREERALRSAFGDLLLDTKPQALAEQGLDWAIRIVGGEGGVIAAPGGRLLAERGVDPTTAAALADVSPGTPDGRARVLGAGRPVLVAPLALHEGTGVVAVVTGPFTPSLGGEEVGRLGTFAVALATALERTRLADALARETARQDTMLRAMSDLGKGCVVLENGRIIFANDAFCNLVSRSLVELAALGSPVDVFAVEDREDIAGRIARGLIHGEPIASLETAVVTPDGRRVEVEMAGKAIEPGGQYIAVCRDVSERHRARLELERSNADLEEFAYVASHDLQEPLRMVASYLQLLDGRYRDSLDDTGHEFLSFAVDGALRMQNLINDLLTYSRAGATVAAKPVDCGAVVRRLLATTLRPALDESHGCVDVDPLPTVFGDAAQIAQVFQNLLTNALKFRGESTPVVTVSGHVDGSIATISVRDNGIGIEQRHLERIFMIFKRLHTRDHYPGTGIGLAICRRIVERHGGRIWAESTPGDGSVFSVALPAAPVPQTDRPAAKPKAVLV